jgi:hypothetical protein
VFLTAQIMKRLDNRVDQEQRSLAQLLGSRYGNMWFHESWFADQDSTVVSPWLTVRRSERLTTPASDGRAAPQIHGDRMNHITTLDTRCESSHRFIEEDVGTGYRLLVHQRFWREHDDLSDAFRSRGQFRLLDLLAMLHLRPVPDWRPGNGVLLADLGKPHI